jgi:hypothetical protein
MHHTLLAAKESAERLRKQGTVFKIKEQPAILFQSRKGCLIVTEINNTHPLDGYAPFTGINESLFEAKHIKSRGHDTFMRAGASILQVAQSFEQESRFWKKRPPKKDGVIVVASENPKLLFEALPRRNLLINSSSSKNKGSRMTWKEEDGDLKITAIKKIVSEWKK